MTETIRYKNIITHFNGDFHIIPIDGNATMNTYGSRQEGDLQV